MCVCELLILKLQRSLLGYHKRITSDTQTNKHEPHLNSTSWGKKKKKKCLKACFFGACAVLYACVIKSRDMSVMCSLIKARWRVSNLLSRGAQWQPAARLTCCLLCVLGDLRLTPSVYVLPYFHFYPAECQVQNSWRNIMLCWQNTVTAISQS